MNKDKALEITSILCDLYPDAKCFLDHKNNFELLVATMLSAQTTDERVNMVTKELFTKYPTPESFSSATVENIKEIIKSVGLANTKAKNLLLLANRLCAEYNGVVPSDFNELVKLPGVGRKTANVVLAVGFNVPAFAVDTHVYRVSYRLGFRKESDDLLVCETKLKKYIKKDMWILMHHAMILFGRNYCKAQKPLCDVCPLRSYCKVKKSA